MADLTIRKLDADEMMDIAYPMMFYAFEPSPPLGDREDWEKMFDTLDHATVLVGFEADKPMVSVASSPMVQNIRGKMFDFGAIWGVAANPEARRKGYARRAMACLLETVREDGMAITCLYPFYEPFYEKLGYVTFPQARVARFKPDALAPVLDMALDGVVERRLVADGFDDYLALVNMQQARTHGMAQQSHFPKSWLKVRNRYWLATARVDGELVGGMIYVMKGDLAKFKMKASSFFVSTEQARYLLLDWMARHVNQVEEIILEMPPAEHPETWLAGMAIKQEGVWPPMGRVLDVRGIGGIPVGPGAFTARIADSFCPWNEGVYRFASEGGVLAVSDAQDADCSLSIRALTALIYGTHDPVMFGIRGWGDPSPETQAVMRDMFPPALPYLYEKF